MSYQISVIWSTDDLRELDSLKESPYASVILEEDLITILDQVERRHDASIGINWDVLEFHLDDYIHKNREELEGRNEQHQT